MHFLETYALNSGLKIDKPFIFEKYYPIESNDYIIFSCENYKYLQDVIDIINPYLNETKIIYLKHQSDDKFEECHKINDIGYNQAAYLIGKSKLYFGEPSIFTDLASHYGVRTVTIYSNAFPQNVLPYWGMKNDFQVLVKDGVKPVFDIEKNYNILNSIRPEQIAKKILNALKIEHEYNYETVYMGSAYRRNDILIEVVPDNNDPVLMQNPNCAVRMDLKFDEEYLYDILQLRPLQIWTDKPINYKILEEFKENIQQVFYIITQDDSPDFVKTLKEHSIRTRLVTFLEEKELNNKKLSYIDYDPIINLSAEKKELKNLPINSLFYSSCKAIYESGVYYASDYARATKTPIGKPFDIGKLEEHDILLRDLRYFKILSKQD
jgi:hypothetical protein